jgi:hypothetical protein
MGLGPPHEMKIAVTVTAPRKRGSTSVRKELDSRSPAFAEDKLRGNDRPPGIFDGARRAFWRAKDLCGCLLGSAVQSELQRCFVALSMTGSRIRDNVLTYGYRSSPCFL